MAHTRSEGTGETPLAETVEQEKRAAAEMMALYAERRREWRERIEAMIEEEK